MYLLRNRFLSFLFFVTLISGAIDVQASAINFSGTLDFIEYDEGGGVYSGVATGTEFQGSIDDDDADGFISDGTTFTSFGCCIAAGGLSVSNNMVLTQEEVTYLNGVLGSQEYSVGNVVDSINIEGDKNTNSGGRIEIGISYILPADSFDSDDISNYPVNQNDIDLTLFFIHEEDSSGQDIYSAGGRIIESQSTTDLNYNLFLNGEYYWCNYFADDDTEFGEATFDGNGTATVQGFQTSHGDLSNVQGTYTIELNGSVSTDDNKGMVSSDGNFLFLVDNVGIVGVDIFVKKSSGLSNSILNGEYYIINYYADNYTDFGEVIFDGVGGFTYETLETSDGSPLSSDSGTYTVSSDGQIAIGDIRGMVSPDGNVISLVDTEGIPGLVIFIKKSSGLSNSILNGDYHVLSHFSDDFATFGEAIFDGDETMTYQQIQISAGELKSGQELFTVDSDGLVKLRKLDEDVTVDYHRGVVSSDGNYIFLVYLNHTPGIDILAKKLDTSSDDPTPEPDCSDIAGDWEGNWSETSCDNQPYSGTWTGTVSSDCSFTGTDNWDTVSGTIDPNTLVLTATGTSNDGCGTINVTGTFTINSVSGNYTYSLGGSGTYSGNEGNIPGPVNEGEDTPDDGGGGSCFVQALKE